MDRPSFTLQDLLNVGRLAVYRSMWAVLRELYQPAVTAYTLGTKADASDVTKAIDSISEAEIARTLETFFGQHFDRGYYLQSEEGSPNRAARPGGRPQGPEDEEIIVFVDPVDFTMAAGRRIDGSILVSFYHRGEGEQGMLAAVVGDIFHRTIYCGTKDQSPYSQEVLFEEDPRSPLLPATKRRLDDEEALKGMTREGFRLSPLRTSGKENLENTAVCVFLNKPGRLLATVAQGNRLWGKKITFKDDRGKKKEAPAISEIYSVGGSLGPIRVADGTWDASIEFVKGFRVWDFAPGAFVASRAGASVIDIESGKEFEFRFGLAHDELRKKGRNLISYLSDRGQLDKDRRKFVVAATENLAQGIRTLLIE